MTTNRPHRAQSKNSNSNDKWARSDSYRSDFLKYNKGLFGCLYFCVYCGKPITRKHMQVDHHIAINHVKKNPLLKIYFSLGNFFSNAFGKLIYGTNWKKDRGVNVSYNLLPACATCNRNKSDKGGVWILRGLIGGTIWKIVNVINNFILNIFKTPLGPILMLASLAAILLYTPVGKFLLTML